MEATTVHAFEQDHVPAGVQIAQEIAIPAWLAMSTAVAMIFLAPWCVRRLLSATYIPKSSG